MGMTKKDFGTTKNGQRVTQYTLTNSTGMKVAFLDLGAVITNIWVPDRDGLFEDVVLGYDTVAAYEVNGPSFGAPVGRVANRISGACFTIGDKEYHLDKNNGKNCLHSGFLRYNHLMYEADYEAGEGEDVLCFSRLSKAGEQNFPGDFEYSVTYRLTDANELLIEYEGVSDEDTVVNMTNHSYFNLGKGGHKAGSVFEHQLRLFAGRYNPVNDELYPTGEFCQVEGTPFDFREFKPIGQDIVSDPESPNYFAGYDHNFVLDRSGDEKEIITAAICREPSTGRELTVLTDQPGIQIYTAPTLSDAEGKEGTTYGSSGAVCFETQNYPNAINTPEFPDIVLKAGQTYHTVTVFRFGVY